MNRLRNLLLACAIVPLSQIAMQAAVQAEEGGLLLAQAGPPACQPGDPNCVPPEKVAPQKKQPATQPEKSQPEAQPEATAPRPEAQPEPSAPKAKPERRAPEPEVQPEVPRPEAQPEPAPKREAKPERPAAEPEVRPETSAPSGDAQPELVPPKKKAKPERPAAEPEVRPEAPAASPQTQSEPPAPKQDVVPDGSAAQPEVRPEAPAAPDSGTAVPERKKRPERPAPKPDAQPDRPAPPADTTAPAPEPKPAAPAPEPTAQPKPPIPAPAGTPDGTAPQPSSPNTAAPAPAPGTPPPPAQQGDQPLPPDVVEKQAPPPALIQKLVDPGAAAAQAIDQSVEQKAGNIREVQRERRVISDENGVQVTVEPGGRVIVQSGDEAVIRHDDRFRFDRDGRDYRERRTREGGREILVTTRNGDEVRTLYDPNGMIIQRERRDRDGRVYVLFDNRGFGPGPVDEPDWQPVVQLPPPPVYDIPRERYRVEMRSAPPEYVEEALTAPPLVEVQPQYTLDQVLYSPDLRERVRSVDLDTVTFASGAWTIEPNQVRSLDAVARGIEAALQRNPNEVFLVEGYTDAVGSVVDNLSLSDRRAEAVANTLTDQYNIPPENLVTQGYGEKYLKVQTEGPERANRRVTVRRITPLLATKAQQQR